MFAKVFITLALVCAFKIATLNAQTVSVNCPQVCPLYYSPVCGTDGDNFREFSNPCDLKANNCRMKNAIVKPFEATDMDWCRTELVNAMDDLLVKMNNLDLTAKPECLKPCTMIYQPVCISNGKYRILADSQCAMDSINCALGSKDTFKVLQDGNC